jgi:hypothetical protein
MYQQQAIKDLGRGKLVALGRMVCPCLLRGGKTRKARRNIKRGGRYAATARNRALVSKYKSGKSIGFTAKASLKAKGLLPRSNGTYRLGPKYSGGSCGDGVCTVGGGTGLVYAN